MLARPFWVSGFASFLDGKTFEVWDGEQLRDFTYIDAAVDALLLAAADNGNGRSFNVGGHRQSSGAGVTARRGERRRRC